MHEEGGVVLLTDTLEQKTLMLSFLKVKDGMWGKKKEKKTYCTLSLKQDAQMSHDGNIWSRRQIKKLNCDHATTNPSFEYHILEQTIHIPRITLRFSRCRRMQQKWTRFIHMADWKDQTSRALISSALTPLKPMAAKIMRHCNEGRQEGGEGHVW